MSEKELSTIKKPNEKELITREEYDRRNSEIAKCKRDIVYFCENYYRINSLDKGLHVVKLYDVQKDLINFVVDNNRAIVCAARQSGKSSIYCMYVLWLTCFWEDKRVMILAQKESTALEILDRIKTGYEYLPKWIKPGCVELNKKSITFSNRSWIKGMSSSSDGARGQSCNVLILDEFAFLPPHVADKLFTSVYPVISSSKNGKVIIVSTPNGTSNLYYELWQKANSKESRFNLDGWKPFTMWWWQIPGRDEAWKNAQIAAIGKQRFEQEFNNQFLSSDKFPKLVPDDILEKFRLDLSKYKEMGVNQGKEMYIQSLDKKKVYTFTMYHEFQRNRTYMASADVAEGVGGDSSVLYVWDITDTSNIKMCLKFSDDRVSIIEFAYITVELLKKYLNPFLSVESNGIGVGYIEQLRVVYDYENIVRLNRQNGYGINSHMVIKSKACIWFSEMLTTLGFGFELYDKELINEMATFVKKDTKMHSLYTAIGNNHDDHIMALIWMTWILNEENIEKYYIITDTFVSSLGKTLPKTLYPLYDYTYEEIQSISNDPIYREFILFKESVSEKYKQLLNQERLENNNDPFVYLNHPTKIVSDQEYVEYLKRIRQIGNVNKHEGLFSFGNDDTDWYDIDSESWN